MKHPPTDQSTKHPAAWSITKPKKTTYTQLVNPTEQPSHASTQLVLSPNEPTQKIPWRTIRISLIDPTNHRNFYSPIQPIFPRPIWEIQFSSSPWWRNQFQWYWIHPSFPREESIKSFLNRNTSRPCIYSTEYVAGWLTLERHGVTITAE